jgi:hypothetical protein
VFARFPQLSNRAVSRLTGTSPKTVGRVRERIATVQRVQASGRRARGGRQTVQYYDEQLPDESAALHRAYHHGQSLYVGTPCLFLRRLAAHGRRPWWPKVAHVSITHSASRHDAFEAESLAILTEQPKYNVGKPGKVTASLLTRPRVPPQQRRLPSVRLLPAGTFVPHAQHPPLDRQGAGLIRARRTGLAVADEAVGLALQIRQPGIGFFF